MTAMKTNMASTSLQTYDSLGVKAYLQPKEIAVMDLMRKSCALTREQIAQRLGWKESAVCGRVNSLVTKGALQEVDGGRTVSGRPAKLVKLAAGQLELLN